MKRQHLPLTFELFTFQTMGKMIGLDTRSPTNLWKDKAMIEVNIAVLHSFQVRSLTNTLARKRSQVYFH